MTKDMWLVAYKECEYNEAEDAYFYADNAYHIRVYREEKVLFLNEEEAVKKAIELTRHIFSSCDADYHSAFEASFLMGSSQLYAETHYYRCFNEIMEIITEVPSAVSGILDVESSSEETIVDLFPSIIISLKEIVIEKEDPCYESLLDSLARHLYLHYMTIERIPEESWGGGVREAVDLLSNMKKDLETQIAALEERKRMMEVLY